MIYRNIKTGAEIISKSVISAPNYILVEDNTAPKAVSEEAPKQEPPKEEPKAVKSEPKKAPKKRGSKK